MKPKNVQNAHEVSEKRGHCYTVAAYGFVIKLTQHKNWIRNRKGGCIYVNCCGIFDVAGYCGFAFDR